MYRKFLFINLICQMFANPANNVINCEKNSEVAAYLSGGIFIACTTVCLFNYFFLNDRVSTRTYNIINVSMESVVGVCALYSIASGVSCNAYQNQYISIYGQ